MNPVAAVVSAVVVRAARTRLETAMCPPWSGTVAPEQ